jgi:ABC-type Fe2+-enterobactin transport system substrate-binding protein
MLSHLVLDGERNFAVIDRKGDTNENPVSMKLSSIRVVIGLAYWVRSWTIQSGSAALTDSSEWLVSTASTFAPAALPLLMPAGASSTTKPVEQISSG